MKNLFLARIRRSMKHPYTCLSWVRDLDGEIVFCSRIVGHKDEQHVSRNGLRWATDPTGVIHVQHPADPQEICRAIAHRIRAELVCCEIYERVQVRREMTLREAMDSRDWHDLCYWGEAAARLAEGYAQEQEDGS